MPWKSKSDAERSEALIGCNAVVKKRFKLDFTSREKKFMEQVGLPDSRFFSPLAIIGDADWLVTHVEQGQTFESFWGTYVLGVPEPGASLNDGGRSSRARSVMPTKSGRHLSTAKPKRPIIVGILPLGLFPGDEQKRGQEPSSNVNTFLVWLQTYCKAFFCNAKVVVLPPVSVSNVACQYRVNQLTGRFQLKANDILNYLKTIKSNSMHCIIAITMFDLYPKPSWDFVFGLATTNKDGTVGGVGVFSFARFDDVFYETWTQGKDQVQTNQDGSLNFSVFDNPSKRIDGSVVPVTDILLRRACNVMAHEICHMFGLKHCVYVKCLMNGSNHLQESDTRPSYLCPVCLRKLQAILRFNFLERYRGLREWMTAEFWKDYKYDPKENQTVAETKSKQRSQARRTSLPDFSRPSTSMTSRSRGASTTRKGRTDRTFLAAQDRRLSTAATTVTVFPQEKSASRKTNKQAAMSVVAPPLNKFNEFRDWLCDAIKYLAT